MPSLVGFEGLSLIKLNIDSRHTHCPNYFSAVQTNPIKSRAAGTEPKGVHRVGKPCDV
jgi:hypothetical protein